VSANEPMLEFQVAHPDELRRRLSDAGLRNVTVDSSHEERIELRTGQQLWNWTVGSKPIPGHQLLAGLTEEQRTDVIRVLDGMIRERSDGNGPAVLTAPLNIGVGTK
jgi:hypothetical protein